MPIDIELFRKAQLPLHERIQRFFQQNPGKAYALFEIAAGVEETTPENIVLLVALNRNLLDGYRGVIEQLVEKKALVKGEVGGIDFYALASQL